jgi:hypothetical protein
MGKMFQNVSSLKPLGQFSLALIIFVVSEKKAFEHFPIVSNVNLCPVVVAILDFRSAKKTENCRGPSNDKYD